MDEMELRLAKQQKIGVVETTSLQKHIYTTASQIKLSHCMSKVCSQSSFASGTSGNQTQSKDNVSQISYFRKWRCLFYQHYVVTFAFPKLQIIKMHKIISWVRVNKCLGLRITVYVALCNFWNPTLYCACMCVAWRGFYFHFNTQPCIIGQLPWYLE